MNRMTVINEIIAETTIFFTNDFLRKIVPLDIKGDDNDRECPFYGFGGLRPLPRHTKSPDIYSMWLECI